MDAPRGYEMAGPRAAAADPCRRVSYCRSSVSVRRARRAVSWLARLWGLPALPIGRSDACQSAQMDRPRKRSARRVAPRTQPPNARVATISSMWGLTSASLVAIVALALISPTPWQLIASLVCGGAILLLRRGWDRETI